MFFSSDSQSTSVFFFISTGKPRAFREKTHSNTSAQQLGGFPTERRDHGNLANESLDVRTFDLAASRRLEVWIGGFCLVEEVF